jgi:hypothetical protein
MVRRAITLDTEDVPPRTFGIFDREVDEETRDPNLVLNLIPESGESASHVCFEIRVNGPFAEDRPVEMPRLGVL